MINKKRVLIPLDGSAFSLKILEPIKQLLSPELFELIILCVEVEPKGQISAPRVLTGSDVPSTMHQSHRDAVLEHHPVYANQEEASIEGHVRQAFSQLLRSLTNFGYETRLEIRFGEPAHEILAYTETSDVDMIALTTHSRSGVSRMLFGSVASELIRRSNLPVLTINPKER
jgi:nucleotide-binding universal stress UspA family protein